MTGKINVQDWMQFHANENEHVIAAFKSEAHEEILSAGINKAVAYPEFGFRPYTDKASGVTMLIANNNGLNNNLWKKAILMN